MNKLTVFDLTAHGLNATEVIPIFGFDIVTEVPGVPSGILNPRDTWMDQSAYDATAKKLAGLFNKNFETYAAGASEEVRAAGPKT